MQNCNRTHQIRVHLQYLEDVQNAHQSFLWREYTSPDYVEKMLKWSEDDTIIPESPDLLITDRPDIDPICLGCNVVYRQPSMNHFRMHLHCWKYETSRGLFEASLPDWAKEDVKVAEEVESEKTKICC
uniref:Uncharacterized protein n=1 Tax=Panagrolaimus sp. ES5 TaxID=591445 RepID=A0AC34FYH6_9BILA